MPVPSDTNTADLYEVGNWFCPKCHSRLVGEIDEDIFVGRCGCPLKWYVQLPKRAGYYLEDRSKQEEEDAKPEMATIEQPA
jgi:hypothetical protein